MAVTEVDQTVYVYDCERDEIYIAPSGVQKERILPEDLFVQTIKNEDLDGPPPQKKLKKSQCTPLFMNAYTMRGELCCCCYLWLDVGMRWIVVVIMFCVQSGQNQMICFLLPFDSQIETNYNHSIGFNLL